MKFWSGGIELGGRYCFGSSRFTPSLIVKALLLEGGVDCEDEIFGVRGVVCGQDKVGEGLKEEDCDC